MVMAPGLHVLRPRRPAVALRRSVLVAPLFLLPAPSAMAQRTAKCDSVTLPALAPNTNAVETMAPAGQAIYAPPGSDHEDIQAAGVCVAMLNRADGSLIRAGTTDERGLFAFDTLPPGDYLLVAGMPTLHLAVQPFRVPTDRARVKETRLLVHLRSRQDTRTSAVSLVTDPALRRDLVARYAEDQAIRESMIAAGADHVSPELMARIDSLAEENQEHMREIVSTHGWPGRDLVGMDGSEDAFTLVQHAGHAFQKEMLPIVEKAYRSGHLTGQDLALLTDRVLVRDGKPQRYGTQALPADLWTGHQPVLQPIEDSANVDRRRAALGMQPLAEYVDTLKRLYFPKPPSSP